MISSLELCEKLIDPIDPDSPLSWILISIWGISPENFLSWQPFLAPWKSMELVELLGCSRSRHGHEPMADCLKTGPPNPRVFVNFSSEEWHHKLECGIDHTVYTQFSIKPKCHWFPPPAHGIMESWGHWQLLSLTQKASESIVGLHPHIGGWS